MSQPFEKITLSIVSHGQTSLVESLLADLSNLSSNYFEVILTLNLSDDELSYKDYPFFVRIIRNANPKGFGANHNAAFLQSTTKWFAVVNPDIRICSLNFQELLLPFSDEEVGAVAPMVLSAEGVVEDNARRFPTLFGLSKRLLFGRDELDYKVESSTRLVDWVAGMFVVFRRSAYSEVGGFDDLRFFMYFEDVDICRRLNERKWKIVLNGCIKVTHMAQRASHRKLKYFRWHVISALRYLSGL